MAFSPPLLRHKKPTRGPAPILLPLGSPPCCQCREDAQHPGCCTQAWGHRAGLVPDLSPGLERRGTGRELSPWFWPVNQPLVLGLSLWAGAHRSQVSPSWRSLNQRWAGAESVPENEHTAHPRPPPHAPHRCQALRMSGRHTEHFLLVCTNLNTSISQSQKEFEAQVFKDPNEFNEV